MRELTYQWLIVLCVAFLTAGCGTESSPQQSVKNPATGTETTTEPTGPEFLLNTEPQGAQEVIQVRKEAKDDDEVIIVGRIGGKDKPWIEGRAAFSIVDNSLKACSDIPGDKCPIPWDYCCETDRLPTATALVKIVDDNGQLVKSDARQLLGVKELQTVVVTGKAERDEAGNLTVNATKVYVKK